MILKENEVTDLAALDVQENQVTNFYAFNMNEIKNNFQKFTRKI
ncbi:hypothetical protein ACFQY3_02485 [Paenibacillus farraposensis]